MTTEAVTAFPRERLAERDEDDCGTTQGFEVQPPSRLPFLRGEIVGNVQSMEGMGESGKNDDKHGNTQGFLTFLDVS